MRHCEYYKEACRTGKIEKKESPYPSAVYRTDGNAIRVMKWKSSGDINPYADANLMHLLNEQYLNNVTYQIYLKPSIRQKKNETDDEFKERFEIAYLEAFNAPIIKDIKLSQVKIFNALDTMRRLDEIHARNPRECVGYGTCELYNECWGINPLTITKEK